MFFCRFVSQHVDVSSQSSVGMFTFHNVLHCFDAYTECAKQFTLCIVMSNYHFVANLYTMSQKKQSKLFSSELRQISINFDIFWQKDGQDDEIM